MRVSNKGNICSIESCNKPVVARGWCNRHYKRWIKYGDPSVSLIPMSEKGASLKWIKEAIATRNRDKCWDDWPFSVSNGYAQMFGKYKRATHMSLELNGFPRPEPPYDNALHSCDNKLCVNPDHLRWGDLKDNSQDYHSRWGYCPHCDHCNRED